MPRPLLALLSAGLLLSAAALGLAQATVNVQVRRSSGGAGEAVVRLAAEAGGRTFQCRTREGRCRIGGVPGGAYVVTAEPTDGGERPRPRSVLIPPTGDTELIVTLP
ncbi:MAG: carboxypeptidase-like regulatory domain-containing protein [Sandaracinaceae bacterium]